MREPEFLPSWYPNLRRRRLLVIAQAWVTGALLLGLMIYWFILHHGADSQRAALNGVNQQLVSTDTQLHRLQEIETLTQELEQQDDVVRRLGTHVPAARLLNVLSDAMPKEMALKELTMQTEELSRSVPSQQPVKSDDVPVDHIVKLRVVGVTPTDVELSTFIGGMEAIPYFSDVQLVNSKDSVDGGHLMREFDVTFSMDLDPGVNAEAAAR